LGTAPHQALEVDFFQAIRGKAALLSGCFELLAGLCCRFVDLPPDFLRSFCHLFADRPERLFFDVCRRKGRSNGAARRQSRERHDKRLVLQYAIHCALQGGLCLLHDLLGLFLHDMTGPSRIPRSRRSEVTRSCSCLSCDIACVLSRVLGSLSKATAARFGTRPGSIRTGLT
jgi:hypothetical protein